MNTKVSIDVEMSFSTHCFCPHVSTPYCNHEACVSVVPFRIVGRSISHVDKSTAQWAKCMSPSSPSAAPTPAVCLSVCRTPLGLMLSGVTSKEEFLSFPSSARPGKGSARPPNGGRHREQAVSYGPFIGVLTGVVKGERARVSAVRGPHAKINCSFGDSFTGENSCMASGQLTQPALMRMRRMHPTSLKCCSPKTTNIVHSAYGRQV